MRRQKKPLCPLPTPRRQKGREVAAPCSGLCATPYQDKNAHQTLSHSFLFLVQKRLLLEFVPRLLYSKDESRAYCLFFALRAFIYFVRANNSSRTISRSYSSPD